MWDPSLRASMRCSFGENGTEHARFLQWSKGGPLPFLARNRNLGTAIDLVGAGSQSLGNCSRQSNALKAQAYLKNYEIDKARRPDFAPEDETLGPVPPALP